MDKQKPYKVKIVPLVIGIILIIASIVFRIVSTIDFSGNAKYTEKVEGNYSSECTKDDDEKLNCETVISYEVNGETYKLNSNDSDSHYYPSEINVLYDPNNPADAIRDPKDKIETGADAYNSWRWNKLKRAIPLYIGAFATVLILDAFLGYFIDRFREKFANELDKTTRAEEEFKKKNN
ncbi:hypothetical protein IJM16_00980 [Candidatus Saccharibacteria bacterium]|nr:hypothetical protein [Candidatus Saccharibacteria bacterium]